MCKVYDPQTRGYIKCGDHNYGEGRLVGEDNMQVAYDRDGNIVAAAPLGFTESEQAQLEDSGMAPGSLLHNPIYVTNDGKVVPGHWAEFEPIEEKENTKR